jgi:hypothetical protein
MPPMPLRAVSYRLCDLNLIGKVTRRSADRKPMSATPIPVAVQRSAPPLLERGASAPRAETAPAGAQIAFDFGDTGIARLPDADSGSVPGKSAEEKWSTRKTLLSVICSSILLWGAIIMLYLYLSKIVAGLL